MYMQVRKSEKCNTALLGAFETRGGGIIFQADLKTMQGTRFARLAFEWLGAKHSFHDDLHPWVWHLVPERLASCQGRGIVSQGDLIMSSWGCSTVIKIVFSSSQNVV
jgi:hypothetical protein